MSGLPTTASLCPTSGVDKETSASLIEGQVSQDNPPSPATLSVTPGPTEQEIVNGIYMSLSTEEPEERVDQSTRASSGRVVYSSKAPELNQSSKTNTEPWIVEVRKELLETVGAVTDSAGRRARSGSLTRGRAGRKVEIGKVPAKPMEPLTVELPRPQATFPTLPLGRSNSIGRAAYNDKWRCAPLDDDKDDEKNGDEDDDAKDDDSDDDQPKNASQAVSSVKGYGRSGNRTECQQRRLIAKRARAKINKKAKKEEAKAASLLASQIENVTLRVSAGGTKQSFPLGTGSKRAADSASAASSGLKKPKLEDCAIAQSLASYLKTEGGNSATSGTRSNSFFSHGPITVPELRSFAHTLHDLHQDNRRVPPLVHPSDALMDADGLLTLQLGPDQSSVSLVEVSRKQRSGDVPTTHPTFYASGLFSLAGQIQDGSSFQCCKCRSSHWPVPKTKIVFVTHSEVLAASGFPNSLTNPSATTSEVNPTSPQECWDTVWVLGGLMSDPAKIIKSLYGSFVGELVIFLDLGTLAIKHGESASSVMDRLVQLCGYLVNSLRFKAKGNTRVLVLPPLIHLGDKELALHQEPTQPATKLALKESLELKHFIDIHNRGVAEMMRSPLQTWGDFASSVITEVGQDAMLRTVHEVKVRVAPTSLEGEDGALHLQPASIHNMVQSLVAFAMTHPYATWGFRLH